MKHMMTKTVLAATIALSGFVAPAVSATASAPLAGIAQDQVAKDKEFAQKLRELKDRQHQEWNQLMDQQRSEIAQMGDKSPEEQKEVMDRHADAKQEMKQRHQEELEALKAEYQG
ncbi:hypothetical protein [Kordiimonas sp.]|uniref:hypothetical protein n=1 Tax=Kordiimonas sp. TaxID=1970157 RepID=UPI003B51BC35